jgi:uncharacterized protein YjlB
MARAAAYGRPGQYNAPLGTDTFIFKDDGSVPNSRLPLIVRQGAITPDATDPASAFERTFAKNGWTKSWRDGIFDYHHYHSTAHEALGVATGSATVRFGGENGETVGLTAGDVVVIPAGVGHARIGQSHDFSSSAPMPRAATGTSSARPTPAPSARRASASGRCPCRRPTRSTARMGR